MLHRAIHVTAWDGSVLARLLNWKNQGKISAIGVSVQSPEELISILNNHEIQYIQLPFNIIDSRWEMAVQKLIQEKNNE